MPISDSSNEGVEALRAAVVAVDVTGRGALAVSGPDAAELLHGLVTNEVKALPPGSGCHAALLTPKGRMRAELAVLRVSESEVLLDCDPSLAEPLLGILQGYVPFSRSVLRDQTSETGVVHLEGPTAAGVLLAAALPEPAPDDYAHAAGSLDGVPVRVVRVSRAGEPGFDVRTSPTAVPALLDLLSSRGAALVSPDVLEAGRIEAGLPRWGAELTETTLPNEAGLERTAISYTKGCYLGQETVARIRTYGHVNRRLVALLLPIGSAAAPGDDVRAGEETVGNVTSAVDSSRRAARVALAYVKKGHDEPGTALAVATKEGAAAGRVAAVPLGR
ncbi:MAG TPA: glycine cleavage T C-terminal barrel domain-containing protein [Thermoanaerobaculia bacterium]|nr:glycine cleavage T C-terminal barrel domain-containing protein [Thermoanaerobaculia bacterium]HQN10208.1 glycine cleavage T C-terminal barrel domain-containing protein [Thermoanaerobaculia bacterium]HQP85807.1 glycine cleavage T C-terminal barrel domain-containing protein [Thermoanaerobaculia bacterium]